MAEIIRNSNYVSKYEGIEQSTEGKLRVIRFNVPKRKNALTPAMYKGFIELLREASLDSAISLVAITGTGEFFSSGNDFGFVFNSRSTDDADISYKRKLVQ